MKGFYEQKYKCIVAVRVKYDFMDWFEDEIKGLNDGHALYLARVNWPGAIVEKIERVENEN